MRLSTIELEGTEVAAVHVDGRGLAPVPEATDELPPTLLGLLRGHLDDTVRTELAARAAELPDADLVDAATARYRPLYREPVKIWGIGLNYRAHAEDLAESHPDEPASFIKASHTIIGHGDAIELPWHSSYVTAEAELGLVFGVESRDVDEHDALGHLAGVCPVLDQTAVDILQRNPRFLTRSKNYPTFFSFGPVLVTIDEALGGRGSLEHINVATYHNGRLHREDVVSGMRHTPEQLISLHTQMMPFSPGDIISPGSPGAVPIEDGDVAECRIEGIGTLRNPVVRPEPAR